jgi:uncharacterized protein YciI
MDLESFELVILRRPPNAPEYDEETLDRLQREHLGFYTALRDSGEVATNGPVQGHPDPTVRGLGFFRTGSVARAREVAEQDPSVKAGRLVVDVVTWLCPPGTMAKPGTLITIPGR